MNLWYSREYCFHSFISIKSSLLYHKDLHLLENCSCLQYSVTLLNSNFITMLIQNHCYDEYCINQANYFNFTNCLIAQSFRHTLSLSIHFIQKVQSIVLTCVWKQFHHWHLLSLLFWTTCWETDYGHHLNLEVPDIP